MAKYELDSWLYITVWDEDNISRGERLFGNFVLPSNIVVEKTFCESASGYFYGGPKQELGLRMVAEYHSVVIVTPTPTPTPTPISILKAFSSEIIKLESRNESGLSIEGYEAEVSGDYSDLGLITNKIRVTLTLDAQSTDNSVSINKIQLFDHNQRIVLTFTQDIVRSVFGTDALTRGHYSSFTYTMNEAVNPSWESLEEWRVKWHVTTLSEGTIVCFNPEFSADESYTSTHVKQNIICNRTPDPYSQTFMESFSSSISITSWGRCIVLQTTPCSITWGLRNHSSDSVTVLEAYLWDEDGIHLISNVTEADIIALGGSAEIDPGGGLSIKHSGGISESTVQGAYTEWIILDNQGKQFKCALKGTVGTCVEN